MKGTKYLIKRIISILAVLIILVQPCFDFAGSLTSYAQTGVVNTDRLNLRSGPGTDYSAIKVLSTNTKVDIIGNVRGNDGYEWLKVSANGTSGYLRSDYVSLNVTYSANDSDFEAYLNAQGFPESYKNALRGLHQKYPNWVFVAQHTDLDWNTAVNEESRIGLNLVYTNNISSFKSVEEGAFDYANNYWPGFDGSVWVAASRSLIEHYMDPRNFLTDPYVFQFQQQNYNSAIQTLEGLTTMVSGTFLNGSASGKNTGNSNTAYGPGYVNNNSSSGNGTSVSPSSGSNSTTGNNNNGTIQFVGPQAAADAAVFSLLGGMTAYADWQKSDNSWFYLNTDGTKNVNGWFWIDGNKDGIAECYYFDENGIMASSCSIDGYDVNEEGQWTVGGKIQTKSTSQSTTDNTSNDSLDYVNLIMKAAQQSGVSPYVLAAMIIQEQGTNGTSELISGTNSEYYGYYNFYNIAAYEHDGMSTVQAGLKYASESGNGNRPWNTVEKGIIGGAIAYGANYVDSGQDTFYLKKFNVQGNNKYKHQFMTNVIAAAQEGAKLSNAYSTEIKNSALTFKIPVYKNMPESACPLPTGDGNPNQRLKTLNVDGCTLNPACSINITDYTVSVDSSVSTISIYGQTVDQNATVNGFGTYTLSSEVSEIPITVTAQNGNIRNYKIIITRTAGGQIPSASGEYSGGPGMVSGGTEINVTNPSYSNSAAATETESNIVIGVAPM